jgi:type VI secretion system secreted protein VgrG
VRPTWWGNRVASDRTIELSVAGKALWAERIETRIAVFEPLRVMADAVDLNAAVRKAADLLGKTFELHVETPLGHPLRIDGVVEAVQRVAAAGGARYSLTLASAVVAPLSVGLDCRAFQKMSAVDIVKDVLSRAGLDAHVRWDTSASYDKRDYTLQYNESDWAFIERVCAEEGIYYFFDFGDAATTLVFADDSTKADPIEGDATLPFRDEAQLAHEAEAVFAVKSRASIASNKVSIDDYDPKRPLLTMDAEASEGAGVLEVYDFPGRYEQTSRGKTLAKTALQARRSLRVALEGGVSGTRLRPGKQFAIDGHPVSKINGKCFCLSVDLTARQGVAAALEPAQEGMRSRWEAIPATVLWRPQPRTAARTMPGPQTGVVSGPPGKELHTSDTGHIRVQFFWDRVGKRDDKSSTWMRVGQFAVGGSMVVPRPGWEVVAEHHNGDADRPFAVQHLYDGKFRVPYALPANKTRTSWQTATTPGDGSSNEVRFEDKKGSEEMFINASKDMSATVGDNSQVQIGVNHTHQIGVNHDVSIGSNSTLGVTGDQSVTIGAMESLTVSGNRQTNIGGSDSQTIGAVRMASISAEKTLDADGGRTLSVGAAMMDVTAMGVSRAVLGSTSVTVGGAWISAAAMGLGNATAGAGSETVGGAKLQLGGGGVKTAVKGALSQTVGGAMISNAGGDAGEGSKGPLSISVGGAMVANAPTITIEAKNKIEIIVGGSSLTITSSSIELKAPSLASPGATIDKDGSAIHHNP